MCPIAGISPVTSFLGVNTIAIFADVRITRYIVCRCLPQSTPERTIDTKEIATIPLLSALTVHVVARELDVPTPAALHCAGTTDESCPRRVCALDADTCP